ncbi:hypothetical protein [Microbacterium tenebrionis]|uniref:hypothetical protein n=1 Tax=Microbacterium tenebrionis TaxID=2830665 RepID=UPI00158A19E7|nr:hypothetical protein [Microbacterium ihumii]
MKTTKTPAPRRGSANVASVARVDLIPPIIEVRRTENARIRGLMAGLVGLAVVVAAGSLAASFLANGSEQTLAKEQALSAQLIVEQNRYTEVANVRALLGDYEIAAMSALYSEADWSRIMRELDGAMPDGVTLASEVITVKGVLGAAASSTAVATAGLDSPGVIEITFTATASVFDSPTPLLNRLQELTGYASATVDAVAGDDEGYLITGVIQLNSSALGGTARTERLDQDRLATLRSELESSVIAPPAPAAPDESSAIADAGSTDDLTNPEE